MGGKGEPWVQSSLLNFQAANIISLTGEAGRRGPGREKDVTSALGHEAGYECCPQGHLGQICQLPALPPPWNPRSLARGTHSCWD